MFKTLSNKIKNNKIYKSGPAIDKNVIFNHINNTMISKLTGKNSATDRLVYSSQDPYGGAGGFPRNSSCWLNGVSNISCFSPAQLSGADWRTRAGTLISPRHILLAKHFLIGLINGGTPILFVDDNSNIIIRKIIAYEHDSLPTDITIGLLDSDVPSNIKFAKVLPKNYNTYLNIVETNPVLYAATLDQQEKAIVKTFYFIQTVMLDNGDGTPLIPIYGAYVKNLDSNDQFFSFTESMVTGDSGNPVFLIIDNELIVITTWWTPNTGTFVTTRYDAINNMMNKLGGGYNLTSIDLEYVYNKYK